MALSMIELIGKTPLVQLRRETVEHASIYAKLEMHNPFGMKDRVARQVISEAKRTGELKEGAPIVESSSGTLAMGIALVGTYLGHDVHIVTDPRIDQLTYTKMKALGVHVHIVDEMGPSGGWQQARLDYLDGLLMRYPDAFWPKQYENIENPRSYHELADDLIAEMGHVDILIAGVGSGGSLCGTAERLKEYNPNVKIIAVDAAGSSIFHQNDRPGRLQGGLGNSLQPKNVNYSVIDEVHWLNDEEAFSWTLELALYEKIFAGNSSGSVYAVAKWISRTVDPNTKIACIFPDRGDRYYTTIYDEMYLKNKEINPFALNDSPKKIEHIQDTDQWSYIFFENGKCLHEKAIVY
jgi:S-sulfo-L-cysteine synthase (3-phospho-L-serine-dependent)